MRLLPCCIVVLTACAAAPPHAPTLAELAGAWQLAVAVPPGARTPTLSVRSDGSLSGNSGVNRFRGQVDASALGDGRWQASALLGTRMAGTAEAMELERAFLEALSQCDRARLDADRLVLLRGGRPQLELARVRLP